MDSVTNPWRIDWLIGVDVLVDELFRANVPFWLIYRADMTEIIRVVYTIVLIMNHSSSILFSLGWLIDWCIKLVLYAWFNRSNLGIIGSWQCCFLLKHNFFISVYNFDQWLIVNGLINGLIDVKGWCCLCCLRCWWWRHPG